MGNKHVIAVVDDDESVRQALEGLLLSAGFRVTAFASAEEFLRSADLRTTGCLILDLQMPGMSGLDLQQRLVREGRGIPVVVLTAHGDDDARARALGAGAAAFLRKPFDGEALIEAVETAVANHL